MHWRIWAREKIEEKVRSGEWDNLPGQGQPLPLEDDAHIPEHLRLGYKILRDANMVPPWIEERRALDLQHAQVLALREKWLNEARALRRSRVKLDLLWREWLEAMEKYNRAVRVYEYKAPAGAHKPPLFPISEERKYLQRRYPDCTQSER